MDLEKQAEIVVSDAKKFAASITITVATEEQCSAAGEILQKIKKRLKELDEMRRAITKPLDEAKKKIMTLFKDPTGQLEEIEMKIKKAILDFQQSLFAQQQIENAFCSENEMESIEPAVPNIAGVSIRKIWKFRIVDETKIPREWLMVDEKKIGSAVRKTGCHLKIAGVEIYEETILASSSK